MEGGYINEDDSDAIFEEGSPGGQLKTKNGQKYVVNERRDGIFVSKQCAILSAIVTILVLIISILITYFLTRNYQDDGSSSCVSSAYKNGTVASAGLFAGPSSSSSNGVISNGGVTNGIDTNEVEQNEQIKIKKINLHEGWNPELYTLVIEPNVKTLKNNGTVSIELTRDLSVKGLHPIVIDINNITISDVRVIKTGKSESELQYTADYDENNDTYIIDIVSGVNPKSEDVTIIVTLDFISYVTNTMQGIYRSSYENAVNGQIESMVSTQFSPIDARRAFPCIDQPDKKANFTISIVHETDKTMALSNMPSYFQTYYRPGYIKEDFETTPKMSTYLVALVVSNLVKSNRTDYDKTNKSPQIEVWTKPEVSKMTNYVYKLTRKVLPYYEKYFGIPYEFSKIDLVAIPDFGYSAMENWGLITFRDSSILVPDQEEFSSSAAHTEHVAITVAHELAHQWFGNLVTMKWWDDLWLKEGFASYLSYLAIDTIHPEWEIMKTFPIDEFKFAMADDSDINSHPILFSVKNTIDIRRIFDAITYSKGNIIIRMINSFIGDEPFKLSLRDFLRGYSYKNADRDDLWKIMTEYGHQFNTLPKDMNVKEIMDTWTYLAGYPVLNVSRNETNLVIQQQRYMLPHKNITDNSKWFIPITYKTDDSSGADVPIHWMRNEQTEIVIKDVFTSANNSENYVFLNLDRKNYYRVNYDYASWIVLKKRFKDLPKITRAQLLDDSLHLAKAEYLSYDIPLTFLMEMQSAIDDLLLWSAGDEGLTYLVYMLQREPAYESFRAFMRFVVRPAFDYYKLEEPDTTHKELMHRSQVIKWACRFNYDRCTNAAQLQYREWMRDPKNNMIRPNLKETIYCTALQEGSFQEWYFAFKRYHDTTSASEKEQILSAMGCTTKPWLLSKYLNMTIDSTSGIRKQDGARAFGAVARNPIGYEIAFDFLVTNIHEISEYFGDGFSTLQTMIDSITTYMNKDYQFEQLNKFADKAKKLGLHSISQSIKLAQEKVKNNIIWRSRSYYNLKAFLETIIKDVQINLY